MTVAAIDVCAVGFVPSTPLIVPDLAGTVPAEPDMFRAAARTVVDTILSTEPDRVVVVAACPPPNLNGADPIWDFSGFGLPRPDVLGTWPLPWQLGLGEWLLDDRVWLGPREYVGALSTAVDLGTGRTAYLAVADGSVYFPSQPSDGAEAERSAFDSGVALAVADGDVAGLANVVAKPGEAIGANGPPVWRYVAAAVGSRPVTTSRLVYDESPYGVRYIAGWWLL
jgi:hypothetical protein